MFVFDQIKDYFIPEIKKEVINTTGVDSVFSSLCVHMEIE